MPNQLPKRKPRAFLPWWSLLAFVVGVAGGLALMLWFLHAILQAILP